MIVRKIVKIALFVLLIVLSNLKISKAEKFQYQNFFIHSDYLPSPLTTAFYQHYFLKLSKLLVEIAKEEKKLLEKIKDMKESLEVSRLYEYYDAKSIPISQIEQKRRDEMIRQLEKFLQINPHSRIAPYAMLRLAELYFEKASYEYLKKYELALATGEELPQKDYSKPLSIYLEFLKKYPDFPQKDAVMYLAGYALAEMGKTWEAVENFFEKIAFMPDSPLRAESAMRAGEFWFDMGDLERAEKFYRIVLEYPESPFYSKALYKLGWLHYRLANYSDALTYFSLAYASGEEKDVQLKEEALQFIIASLVELGLKTASDGFDPESVLPQSVKNVLISALRKKHRNPKFYLSFASAELLFKQGRYPEAFRQFKKTALTWYEEKDSVKAAFGALKSLRKIGDINPILEWQIQIAQRWGPKSRWALLWKRELEKYKKQIEEMTLETAKYYHQQEMWDKAIETYKLFLDLFPTSQKTAEAQFYLAEIYFAHGKYIPEAYSWYEKVVKNTVVKENKFLYDAAWGMVISADEAWKRGVEGSGEKLKNAVFLFENLFPLDRKTPIALYKAGKVLEREGQRKTALKIFEKIIAKYPASEIVPEAVKEIVRIWVEEGDLKMILATSLRFRKRTDILKPEDIAYLEDIGSKALFKIAKEWEKRGEWQKATTHYFAIFRLFPNSNILDTALYNVIVIKYKKATWPDVVTLAEIFEERFPNSPFLLYVIFAKAVASEKLFEFEKAAELYEKVIQESQRKLAEVRKVEQEEAGGEKKQLTPEEVRSIWRDATFNLMKVWEGLGEWKKAGLVALEYYKNFAEDERKEGKDPEVYLVASAKYFERAGDIERKIEILKAILTKYKKPNSKVVWILWEIAEGYKKAGNTKEYERTLKKIISTWEKIGDDEEKKKALYPYAGARFYFAQKLFERFDKIRFAKRDSQKAIARKLKRKTELLKEVQKEFSEIAKLGEPYWALASLFYIGYSLQSFADMLINAPLPEEIERLPEEQRFEAEMIYREELEKHAYPLEDKAIQIYQRAVERIKELGIRNEWTDKIFRNLKLLDPLAPVEVAEEFVEWAHIVPNTEYQREIKLEERQKAKAEAEKPLTVQIASKPEKFSSWLSQRIFRAKGEIFFAVPFEDGRIEFISWRKIE